MRDSYDIIREYRTLKTDVLYPYNENLEKDFPHLKEQIINKRERFLELKEKLDDMSIRQLSQCQKNLLLSIRKALELTSNNKLGYPLSRNQGLIIPNYVYGKVIGIMESAMNAAQGFSYPDFYFERDGDFNSSKLRNLLTAFEAELSKKRFHSYLELEEFYEKNYNKLKKLWEEENQQHPSLR